MGTRIGQNEPPGCRIGASPTACGCRDGSFMSTRLWAIASVTFPQQAGTDANDASCTSISIGRLGRDGRTADARTLRITVPPFRCASPVGCATGRLPALPPRGVLKAIPRARGDSSGGYHRQASFGSQATSDRAKSRAYSTLPFLERVSASYGNTTCFAVFNVMESVTGKPYSDLSATGGDAGWLHAGAYCTRTGVFRSTCSRSGAQRRCRCRGKC